MAVGVHAPRVNNNDDVVKLIALSVAVGDRVARGEVLAQVETDKAIVDVESPADGFVIGLTAQVDARSRSEASCCGWAIQRMSPCRPEHLRHRKRNAAAPGHPRPGRNCCCNAMALRSMRCLMRVSG